MKVLLLFFLAFAFVISWELEETGLCIEKSGECSANVQRYGVCCEINGQRR